MDIFSSKKRQRLLYRLNIPPTWFSMIDRHAIIMYHGVVEKIVDPYLDRWNITQKQFQKQLRFLSKYFDFISLGELISILRNKKHTRRPCAVLTFDDAFENIYLTAYPILLQQKIPFVVGIPVGLVNSRRSIWGLEIDLIVMQSAYSHVSFSTRNGSETLSFSLNTRQERVAAAIQLCRQALSSDNINCHQFTSDVIESFGRKKFEHLLAGYPHLKIMNDRQLQELLRNGMEPVCHGYYHIPLDTKNNDMVNQEVLNAKRHISHLFKESFDIKHYILPHGKFNDETLSAIRQAGYDSCLTTKNRAIQENPDLYQLPRIHGHKKKRDLMWTLAQYSKVTGHHELMTLLA